MLVFDICPNSEFRIYVLFSGEMHGKVRKHLCLGSFIKKSPMKLKTKCKKEWTNCQKSQLRVSSCLRNDFFGSPLTRFGVWNSGFVIRYLFSNDGNYLLFVSGYQSWYSSISNWINILLLCFRLPSNLANCRTNQKLHWPTIKRFRSRFRQSKFFPHFHCPS